MSTISCSTTSTTGLVQTSDTTGTLVLKTGASPTTAVTIDTSQVVTFAKQPAGTFAGTGPAFSAYSGAATSISNATWTKIGFDTEDFDTNSNFASSRFTPTVAGYYLIQYGTGINGATSSEVSLFLYKNGSQYKQAFDLASTNNWILGGTHLVYLNGSTDYVEVYLYQGSGTTKNSATSSILTWFQGFMARAA